MERRFFIIAGLSIAAISAAVLAYIIATTYYSSVSLRVMAACMANNNNTQPRKSCDEQVAPPPFRIQGNDSSNNNLEQTPKLKEAYSGLPDLLYSINPTMTLWPKSAMVVTVSYRGNAYELYAQYKGWLALTQI